MAKKSRDTTFDDGMASREQDRAFSDGLLQMGAPKSKTPRLMARLLVWGFVILMPVSLILSFVVADNNRSLNTELSKTLETQYNPSFRVRYDNLGAEVISAWYNKQAAPINLDSNVVWVETAATKLSGETTNATVKPNTASLKLSGVSFLRGSQIESKGNAGRYEERLEYYVLINGVPQIVGVTIAIPNLEDISSLPVLVSAPSVIGKPNVGTITENTMKKPTDVLGPAVLTETAKVSLLNTWAKAWTEDDSAALKAATQDSNNDNTYRGLGGGWVYVPNSAKVEWSALAPDAGGNAVARVTWEMQTPTITVPPVTGASPQPAQTIVGAVQKQSMDVLIGKFDQGSPSMLAWGQVGTYMELKPLRNALTKEDAAKIATPLKGGEVAPSAPANIPAPPAAPSEPAAPSAPSEPAEEASK
jgi:hypothetical protein